MKLTGTYFDGKINVDTPFKTDKPIKVIITFPSQKEKKILKLKDFSFYQSQELLKKYKGSFSDEVIEERRSEI